MYIDQNNARPPRCEGCILVPEAYAAQGRHKESISRGTQGFDKRAGADWFRRRVAQTVSIFLTAGFGAEFCGYCGMVDEHGNGCKGWW